MKRIQFKIKLYIPSGKASSVPPIGPILGQYRLNSIEFCKDFNEQTIDWDDSIILPVLIIGYEDNSLEYVIKFPTTTHLLRKLLEVEQYSTSNKKYSTICTIQQIYELAISRAIDVANSDDCIYKNIKTIHGTLKAMKVCIIK